MKVLKNFVSIVVLSILIGCEHHDAENTSPSSGAENLQPQLGSDTIQISNNMDSKTVVPSSSPVPTVAQVTNQQPQEIWSSDGYGFENVTLTNDLVDEAGTNSLP